MNVSAVFGQYVHPNQAGRKGGDTGPGIGSQVVTTTYYGTAGNALAQGVIMSVNKDGTNAASFHDFDGWPGDGGYPWHTTPHQASNGKLYGPTFRGGTSNYGSVYEYDFSVCNENIIYNNGSGDTTSTAGGNYANINELSDGKLYGIETYAGNKLLGRLYRMDKDGTNVETLHDFQGAYDTNTPYTLAADTLRARIAGATKNDGTYPVGFVVEGPDGKIYGTTTFGGPGAWGTIWRCNKNGSNYEIIYIADAVYRYATYKDGLGLPVAATYTLTELRGNVAIGQDNRLYFTSRYGGAGNYGGIGSMNLDGSTYRILHSGSVADGAHSARGPIIIDNQVYGVYAYYGGGVSFGTVWKINYNGTGFQALKRFNDSGYSQGAEPWASLSYDGTHLFGSTWHDGGAGVAGTLFKVKPDGTGFTTIHRFSSTSPGTTSSCGVKPGLWTYYPCTERVTFADVKLGCSLVCVSNPAANTNTAAAPTLSATTLQNTCPILVANLTTLSSATNITWHTATPATDANKVVDPQSAGAGTYYATVYDGTSGTYSPNTSSAVTVTIKPCPNLGVDVSVAVNDCSISTPQGMVKTGNAATDIKPTGGIAPIVYATVDCSTGAVSTNTTGGGTIAINASTGAYTYTPAAAFVGFDTFCVKVCDSASPTPACKTIKYKVTVTAVPCAATGTKPATN